MLVAFAERGISQRFVLVTLPQAAGRERVPSICASEPDGRRYCTLYVSGGNCQWFSAQNWQVFGQYSTLPYLPMLKFPAKQPGSHPFVDTFLFNLSPAQDNLPESTNNARLSNMPRQLPTHPTRHATTGMRYILPLPSRLVGLSGRLHVARTLINRQSGSWSGPMTSTSHIIPLLNDSQVSDHLSPSSPPTPSPESIPPGTCPLYSTVSSRVE